MSTDTRFLAGRTALVTCSSRGIGYGVASGLAAAGANLLLCSRDKQKGSLAQACRTIETEYAVKVKSVMCDLHTEAGLDALLQFAKRESRWGGVDILVSNSPHPTISKIRSGIDRNALQEVLFSTLSVPLLLSYALAAYMAKQSWGRIFYMSSCYAVRPTNRFLMSSYLRPALNNLAALMAEKFGLRDVRAMTLMLGYFKTSLTDGFSPNAPTLVRARKLAPTHRRLPNPLEIGYIVSDLCKDHFGLVNGTSLLVDYGYTAADRG